MSIKRELSFTNDQGHTLLVVCEPSFGPELTIDTGDGAAAQRFNLCSNEAKALAALLTAFADT